MIVSKMKCVGEISLPLIDGEYSMIPFDLNTLEGLTEDFKVIVNNMLKGLSNLKGTAYFTIHGKDLKKGQTLRRGGAHTDGNYEPYNMCFGGGGWKVGQGGASLGTNLHERQYVKETGGIILASNHPACKGWVGEFNDYPHSGGDCTHIDLGEGFMLESGKVYYGNNHFIHESLPMDQDVHRVFARITLPEDHQFN